MLFVRAKFVLVAVTDGPRARLQTVGSELATKRGMRWKSDAVALNCSWIQGENPFRNTMRSKQVMASLKRAARRVRHASVASSAGELSAVAKESSKWH